MFANAHDFSCQYTAKFLARSLDLVHVAAARMLRCTGFVSGDDRQLAAAMASRLTTGCFVLYPTQRHRSRACSESDSAHCRFHRALRNAR
jgi:hypothetical protein